eukprot:TRINITY_DN26048_c0_g1_i1.p2 TRINITY_DN26048_c0_g1~~TRINITY_DN26048_c0_g1_i1.p2  ORF type:complete len:127 (+),score=37.92 TRINITY_DN26048_c0_g1_i1:290-670(+)
MQGACASCSASATTVRMGIERTLLNRIPELAEVIAVMPGSETPTEEGIEEVLASMRPFLSTAGGDVELVEFEEGDSVNAIAPRITVGITGPPQRNQSLRAEILKRLKITYNQAIIELVGDEDDMDE